MIKKTNMNIKGICTDVEDLKDIVGEKDDVYLIENPNGVGFKIYVYNTMFQKFVNIESVLNLYTVGMVDNIEHDFSNIEVNYDLLYRTMNLNGTTVLLGYNTDSVIENITLEMKNNK